jgi:hypothetical protein
MNLPSIWGESIEVKHVIVLLIADQLEWNVKREVLCVWTWQNLSGRTLLWRTFLQIQACSFKLLARSYS